MDQLVSCCRICLVDPGEESLIATGEDFCEQIKCCTGIQLSEGPNWPTKICIGCKLMLRTARKLRLLCQESEKQLQRQQIELELQKADKCNVSNEGDSVSIGSDSEMEPEYLEYYEVTHGSPESNTDNHCIVEIDIKTASNAPPQRREQEAPSVDIALSPATPKTESKSSKRFACHICSNIYQEKAKLTVHLLVHSDFKRHECEICHKRFPQTTSLRRHMNTHTGLRPYKCDFCDSSFADPSTRIKHQRIHTNERPYKCTICGKGFAYSNVLRGHLKTHTLQKPYKCQHCQRSFTQMHHMHAHEKSHGSRDMETITVIAVEEE
ncbi:zinc finger protein 22 [Drosophila guanche]|uniref:Blast:Zinc finger protein 782 n=1 Tax=Drosophila guanche TaxID=7266 RepID=A0A3B0KE62_DROGU|nr:zinc finger protein 22 [Drosophila guanche]SPP83966.1 blast:Zinc finger protein 782 [Drosophila guanche]